MAYRVVKQLYPAPSSSSDFTDPPWATRNVYVAKLSGSSDQIWEYSGSNAQASASAKMNELSGSDSSNRLYKVIEV